MVQLSAVPDPSTPPTGARERNRLARHRAYLQAALDLVFAEGLEALTMQRLAAEVGASVGSAYTYFPSKGALVAEVQREAIERLAASAAALGADIDRQVADADADAAVAALAPVVGFGRFWVAAGETHPEEMRLLLVLLSAAETTVPIEEGSRVLPAALRLLGLAEARVAAAADAGALGAGDAWQRTIALAAALTGCIQLAVVEPWAPELLSPATTARTVLDALVAGWGGRADDLAAAHAVIDHLAERGPLARALTVHSPTSEPETP